MSRTIIAIDAGANGGIAIHRTDNPVQVIKMPRELKTLQSILDDYNDDAVVFVEKIGFRPDDIHGQSGLGKAFRIQRMIANYEQLKATIILSGIPFVEVHPLKWQSTLHLAKKGEEKAERKRRYKELAQELFPYIKVTLWNADALLILQFAHHIITCDKKWLKNKMQNIQNTLL